jgi:hypothetical protein
LGRSIHSFCSAWATSLVGSGRDGHGKDVDPVLAQLIVGQFIGLSLARQRVIGFTFLIVADDQAPLGIRDIPGHGRAALIDPLDDRFMRLGAFRLLFLALVPEAAYVDALTPGMLDCFGQKGRPFEDAHGAGAHDLVDENPESEGAAPHEPDGIDLGLDMVQGRGQARHVGMNDAQLVRFPCLGIFIPFDILQLSRSHPFSPIRLMITARS